MSKFHKYYLQFSNVQLAFSSPSWKTFSLFDAFHYPHVILLLILNEPQNVIKNIQTVVSQLIISPHNRVTSSNWQPFTILVSNILACFHFE